MGEPARSTVNLRPSRDRWLYLILLLALVLRTYHLTYPPWDYHNWRQTQTLMVARDFARRGFHLLHPQVAWISNTQPSAPSYFSGEFSVESILTAVLYKIFGESDAAPRLVVIAFSLLGAFFLHALLARRAGLSAGRLGALVYVLAPYHLFFGRVFMPDVPALSLALGAVNALDGWTDDRRWRTLLLAAALAGLALLQKLTVVFIALPTFYLFWLGLGRRLFIRPEPYAFATVSGAPALAWYTHAAALARASGFSIMPAGNFARDLSLWLEPSFFKEVVARLAREAFSPVGLALATMGFFWLARGRAAWIFRLWIIAAAALLVLVPDTLRENFYYLILLVPGGAALAGMAMARLGALPRSRPIVALLVILFSVDALRSARPLYQFDRLPYDLGLLLKRLTVPQDLVVFDDKGSSIALYASERRGWETPLPDPHRIQQLAAAGARVFAATDFEATMANPRLVGFLDTRCYRLTRDDPMAGSRAWMLWLLESPPVFLREVAPGEIQSPFPANFADRVELLGISLREVLNWPTTFRVVYYWQCLKKTESDLRIFVHVTTPSGQSVYGQDHWPVGGHLPLPRWNVGEVVREEYVVPLPGSLPAGQYQMRVGWYDPKTGQRLRILNPPANDGEDRAPVAEIEVRGQPRYRWFNVEY